MSTSLQGKVVVLTGGASGMGLATAKLLCSRGAIVYISDIQEELLKDAVLSILSLGGKVSGTVLDVRSRSQVETWISDVISQHSKIDGAVNLAGTLGEQIGVANIEDIDDNAWDFVIGVNLTGVLNCMRAQIKHLRESKGNRVGGCIVNAASVGGIQGMEKNGAYIASKHAVIGLTRTAAKEQASRGVRVHAIAPGPIDTPMTEKFKQIDDKSRFLHVPMGRAGSALEVAELICWLLCDGSSYMTGTVQFIDGGWTC